jgi:hypothetical protein
LKFAGLKVLFWSGPGVLGTTSLNLIAAICFNSSAVRHDDRRDIFRFSLVANFDSPLWRRIKLELEPVVPQPEQSVFAVVSGTRHIAIGYPNDPPNRTSTGILKKPTVIDRAWETGRYTTFKIKQSKIILGGSHALTKRNDTRARTTSNGSANL